MISFGPLRTANPLNALASGIAGIGYDIGQRRREEEAARVEQERYDAETEFRDRSFDQTQQNADRIFQYGEARNQILDDRYAAGVERDNARRAQDLQLEGMVPDPTVPTGGIATLGQGYVGSRDPGLVYDPEQDIGMRRSNAQGEAAFGRQLALQDDRQAFAAEQARLDAERRAAQAGMVGPKLTEGQRKDALYIRRIEESLPSILETIERGGGEPPTTTGFKRAPIIGGGFLANQFLTSDNAQTFNAQMANVVGALLRKETGAAISKEEWNYANDVWVPLVSDDPQTVEQKIRNIQSGLEGMKAGMPVSSYAPGLGGQSNGYVSDGSLDPDYQAYLQRYQP